MGMNDAVAPRFKGRPLFVIGNYRNDRTSRMPPELCSDPGVSEKFDAAFRNKVSPAHRIVEGGVVRNRLVLGNTGVRKPPAAGASFWFDRFISRQRRSASPGLCLARLERSHAQQRKPMRMVFAGHQFAGIFCLRAPDAGYA